MPTKARAGATCGRTWLRTQLPGVRLSASTLLAPPEQNGVGGQKQRGAIRPAHPTPSCLPRRRQRGPTPRGSAPPGPWSPSPPAPSSAAPGRARLLAPRSPRTPRRLRRFCPVPVASFTCCSPGSGHSLAPGISYFLRQHVHVCGKLAFWTDSLNVSHASSTRAGRHLCIPSHLTNTHRMRVPRASPGSAPG